MHDFLSKIIGGIDVERERKEREKEIETVQKELDDFFTDSESRKELSDMGLSSSQVDEMMEDYFREMGRINR